MPRPGDALARLRAGDVVDYVAVAGLKWRALRAAFAAFKAERDAGARGRISKNSAPSARRCCRALPASRCSGTNSKSPGGNGRRSGGSRTTPNAPSLRNGAGRRRSRVRRIRAMDRRPAACRLQGDWRDQLGMKVGLYLDVAVGVQSDGFDAWNEQAAISRHLGVGAPPDPLNTAGQDWGLAGFNAAGLEAQSFAPYREMLRASMRHAGAIRLDHVLGLKRLYLVPHGFSAATMAPMCRCRSRRCWR